jgi:hypothetical protein
MHAHVVVRTFGVGWLMPPDVQARFALLSFFNLQLGFDQQASALAAPSVVDQGEQV